MSKVKNGKDLAILLGENKNRDRFIDNGNQINIWGYNFNSQKRFIVKETALFDYYKNSFLSGQNHFFPSSSSYQEKVHIYKYKPDIITLIYTLEMYIINEEYDDITRSGLSCKQKKVELFIDTREKSIELQHIKSTLNNVEARKCDVEDIPMLILNFIEELLFIWNDWRLGFFQFEDVINQIIKNNSESLKSYIIRNYGTEYYTKNATKLKPSLYRGLMDITKGKPKSFQKLYTFLHHFKHKRFLDIAAVIEAYYEHRFGFQFNRNQKNTFRHLLIMTRFNISLNINSFRRIQSLHDNLVNDNQRRLLRNSELPTEIGVKIFDVLKDTEHIKCEYITTKKRILEESKNMNHCVEILWSAVCNLQLGIYHIHFSDGNEYTATIQKCNETAEYYCSEVAGYKNMKAPFRLIQELEKQLKVTV